MKVLLATPPHVDTFGYSMPPPGLLRLGGALEAAGHETVLEDLPYRLATGTLGTNARLHTEAAALLLGHGADVVGLSTMGATLPAALLIAETIRARSPRTRLLLGGPGTTGIDVALLERFPFLDAVVRGEGELTLAELLARWSAAKELDGVAGVTWRSETGALRREGERAPIADLAALPDYAWHLLASVRDYREVPGITEGLVALDSGRGCVFDCSFCTIGRFWSRRSRVLPVERLVAEIEAVGSMPGADAAYLCHDIFGARREHALALCRTLVEREVRVPWECRARADHLDEELVEWMGRAGCYRVLLGIESADPDVRNGNAKAIAPDLDALAVVERCARAGITPILSFILGLPGEGERELAATLELALEAAVRAGVNLSFHLVNPQPGCSLGEEHGPSSRPVEGIPPDMAFGTGETPVERALIAAHPDLFSTFALLTGLPGGEAKLRDLHTLATDLPPVLMGHPRTTRHLTRTEGCDVLGLFRRWQEHGQSFATFVAERGDAVAQDLFTWETALVEAPADGSLLVTLAHDPGANAARASAASRPASPVRFAIVRRGRAVRTLRPSAALAALLAEHVGVAPDANDELFAPLRTEGLLPVHEHRVSPACTPSPAALTER